MLEGSIQWTGVRSLYDLLGAQYWEGWKGSEIQAGRGSVWS